MGNYNKVILLGNVTRDPELRVLPSETKVVDFGLASSRKYRTANGEDREETLFVECSAFGRQAEVLHEYCAKGRPLFVEGRLKYDTWEDKQTGQKRSRVSVVVENFQFVGPREGGGRDPRYAGAEREGAASWRKGEGTRGGEREAERMFEESPRMDRDIPF